MSRLRAFYSRFSRPFPPAVLSFIGQTFPAYDGPWYCPMNGQTGRQALVRELFRSLPFERVVETGCYRGASTEFLWYLSGLPTYTVDRSRSFTAYVRRRMRHTGVQVTTGDSRAFLTDLAERTDPDSLTFFYLDAHWGLTPPLAEEVAIITRRWARAVILIDDFQVPDDPGYGFDQYGCHRLNREYLLAGDSVGNYRFLWPNVPAGQETGYRRGCCVLVPPALFESVKALAGLRTLEEEQERTRGAAPLE